MKKIEDDGSVAKMLARLDEITRLVMAKNKAKKKPRGAGRVPPKVKPWEGSQALPN